MISVSTTTSVSNELKQFKTIFDGDERFIEYYRGLYPNNKKTLNISGLKEKNASNLDLKKKTEKLINLINEVESLGKDVNEIRKNLEEISNIKSSITRYSKLESMSRELTNKYGRYLNVKKMLIYINNNSNLYLEDNLNFCIDFFLRELDNLKNDENFINDDLSKFIGDFYIIGVNMMLKEFAMKGNSRLFDYFKKISHDKNLVSEIIYMKIESLWNSKRQIYGLNELDRIIESKGQYLDKDVINQLLICISPKLIKRLLKTKIKGFKIRLNEIYNSIKDCHKEYINLNINVFEYMSIKRKLSHKYKEILGEYKEFMNSYKYFFDGNINDLKDEINNMTYRLKYNNY